jgi:hypothetical protein
LMATAPNPYGDGHAAGRIVGRIRRFLDVGGRQPAIEERQPPVVSALAMSSSS